MNTFLWILQVILAIKLLTVTLTHALQPGKQTIQDAKQKMGAPARPLLVLAAAGTFIAALGVTLPRLLDLPVWLTPVSAALAGGMLLVSIFFHLRSREKPMIFVSLVLFAFAAFIAYGRGVLAP
jgi:drug/metabolite transporter (DMT)-like permease